MKNIIIILLIIGAQIRITIGQDLLRNSVQITGLPLQYLPSFAGNLGKTRIASDTYFSTQNESGFLRSTISGDGFIPKLSTGIGVQLSTASNYGKLDYYNFDLSSIGISLAPKFSTKGKYTFSPGISYAYSYNYYSTTEKSYANIPYDTIIKYGTNYDYINIGGPLTLKGISTSYSQTNYINTTTISFLFNTKKLFLGTGFTYNLSRNYKDWSIPIIINYSFYRTKDSKFSFSPSMLWNINYSIYKFNRSTISYFIPENINLNFRYQMILSGVSYRGLMLGFQPNSNFRIMYSVNTRFSSHYLTVRFLIKNKNDTANQ